MTTVVTGGLWLPQLDWPQLYLCWRLVSVFFTILVLVVLMTVGCRFLKV